MTDEQIKHMVEQFLRWKLPENWHPDGGISFEPVGNAGTTYEFKREPSGTNLFDYTQAKAMVLHMLDGMPALAASPPEQDGWQDIATAPYACHMQLTYWHEEFAEWVIDIGMRPFNAPWTHWRPLPAPPLSAEKQP